MKVEIIDKPIYNLVMTKEDKILFYKVADMLDDIYTHDEKGHLWEEFNKNCAIGYDDEPIAITSFDVLAGLLQEVVELAEIRD